MSRYRRRFWCESLESRQLLTAVLFSDVTISDGLTKPSSVISIDIDNDGDLDVIAAARDGSGQQGTYLFRTDNAGKLEKLERISTGSTIVLESEDLDGDGDEDLLLGDIDATYWLENIDQGSRWMRRQSIASETIFNPVFGDLDDDGDSDLVGVDSLNMLVWFANSDGKGTYEEAQTIDLGQGTWTSEIELVDVDNDSDLDLIASGTALAWYENTGNGFASEPLPNILVEDAYAFGTGDFDDDGATDIVAATRSYVHILRNEIGSFDSQMVNYHRPIDSDIRVEDVLFYDTDGDLDSDILVQLDLDEDFGLDVITNNAGYFETLGRISSLPTEDIVISNRGDLNGDRIDDFIIYTNDEDYIGWIQIDQNTVRYNDIPESSAVNVNSMRTADFDGDSDLDLLVTSRGDSEVSWYENQDGEYVFAEGIVRGSTLDAIPFDVDEDGDLDIITYEWSEIGWFENIGGDTRFSDKRLFDFRAWRANGIASVNLDGDLANELVISDSNGVRVFDVTNRHLKLTQHIDAEDVASLDLGDADNDGDHDLLVSFRVSGRNDNDGPILYVNDGGQFTRTNVLPSVPTKSGSDSAFADMDSDGDLDLLTYQDTGLIWFANDGDNTWGTGGTVVGDSRPYAEFGTADIDSDGDQDVLAFDRWFENQEFGKSFVEHVRHWGAISAAVDVDQDGDLDLFTAKYDRLTLQKSQLVDLAGRIPGDSNGDGRFDSTDFVVVFQAGQYEDGISGNSTYATGDWNGDGEFDSADLVFAFQGGNYVAAATQDFAAAVDEAFTEADRSFHLI